MKKKQQKPMIADGDVVVERVILDRDYLVLLVPLREEIDDDLTVEAEDEISH